METSVPNPSSSNILSSQTSNSVSISQPAASPATSDWQKSLLCSGVLIWTANVISIKVSRSVNGCIVLRSSGLCSSVLRVAWDQSSFHARGCDLILFEESPKVPFVWPIFWVCRKYRASFKWEQSRHPTAYWRSEKKKKRKKKPPPPSYDYSWKNCGNSARWIKLITRAEGTKWKSLPFFMRSSKLFSMLLDLSSITINDLNWCLSNSFRTTSSVKRGGRSSGISKGILHGEPFIVSLLQ